MIDTREARLMEAALSMTTGRFTAEPDSPDGSTWASLAQRGLARGVGGRRWEVTEDGNRALRLFKARDGLGNPIIAHGEYVIETTTEGDLVLFWRPLRCGYTSLWSEAGVYNGWDASAIMSLRGTDTAWPRAHVESLIKQVVRRDDLQPRPKTNGCCGNIGTHGEGGVEYCSTCGQAVV